MASANAAKEMNKLKCKFSKYGHIVKDPIKLESGGYACERCVREMNTSPVAEPVKINETATKMLTSNLSILSDNLQKGIKETRSKLDDTDWIGQVTKQSEQAKTNAEQRVEYLVDSLDNCRDELFKEKNFYKQELLRPVNGELKEIKDRIKSAKNKEITTLEEFYEQQNTLEEGLMKLDVFKKRVKSLSFEESKFALIPSTHVGTQESPNKVSFQRGNRKLLANEITVLYVHRDNTNQEVLFSGSKDGSVCEWISMLGVFNQVLMASRHGSAVTCFMTYENEYLISGDAMGEFKEWSSKRECLRTIKAHEAAITGFYQRPDSSIVVSASLDKNIKIWNFVKYDDSDIPDGPLPSLFIKTLEGHSKGINCLLGGLSMKIYSGSDDMTVNVWYITEKKPILTLKGHTDSVVSLLEHYNGDLISASKDKTVRLWNVDTGECLRTVKADSLIRGVFNYSCGEILIAESNATIGIYNIAKDSYVRKAIKSVSSIECIAKQDNLFVVGDSKGNVQIIDANSGKCMKVLEEKGRETVALTEVTSVIVLRELIFILNKNDAHVKFFKITK